MKLTRKEKSLVSFLVRATLDDSGEVDTKKVKDVYKILQKSEMTNRNQVVSAWFNKIKIKIGFRKVRANFALRSSTFFWSQ